MAILYKMIILMIRPGTRGRISRQSGFEHTPAAVQRLHSSWGVNWCLGSDLGYGSPMTQIGSRSPILSLYCVLSSPWDTHSCDPCSIVKVSICNLLTAPSYKPFLPPDGVLRLFPSSDPNPQFKFSGRVENPLHCCFQPSFLSLVMPYPSDRNGKTLARDLKGLGLCHGAPRITSCPCDTF